MGRPSLTKTHAAVALLAVGVMSTVVGVGAYDWRAGLIALGVLCIGALLTVDG